MFKIIQSISRPGGEINLDLIHVTDNYVLLLDGSTPLRGGYQDTLVFIRGFIREFTKSIHNNGDYVCAINESLNSLRTHLIASGMGQVVKNAPSATLLLAYEDQDELCVINIGDSSGLIIMKDGDVIRIYDDRVSRLDGMVIEKLKEIRDRSGMDISQAVKSEEIKQMLLKNRGLMNKPNGYDILAFDVRTITPDDVIRFKKADVSRVVLYSDGFEAGSAALVKESVRLDLIYDHIRREENRDNTLNKTPRFKVSDDASAVIFEIKN